MIESKKTQSGRIQLIVIGGPTASGKTGLALQLKKNFHCELINADSMQVYKYMDIGTNKKVIGKLFDIVDPDVNFTAADYQKLANEVIQNVLVQGKIPVLVGGTGLYIDAVIKNYGMIANPDTEKRSVLNKKTVEELQKELEKLHFDLNSVNNSERNNPRRLIRLIEKSSLNATGPLKAGPGKDKFDVLFLYPEFEKEDLEKRIRSRVKFMLDNGLVDEVKGLLAKGYGSENKAMQATGYKQVIDYLDGRIKNMEELEEKIYLAHRQYAKRQITWFEGKRRGYDLVKVNNANILQITKKFINK